MSRLNARALLPAGVDRTALTCLIVSMVLGVGGQVALKTSAHELLALPLGRPLPIVAAILTSPRILAALALYLSGTLFWLMALSRTALSVLYPYTALNFVLILIPSSWLLHEAIGPVRVAGVLMIALGIGVHALAGRREAAAAALAGGAVTPAVTTGATGAGGAAAAALPDSGPGGAS